VPDGQDHRDPWSVITGAGRGRGQGKHAAGSKPAPGPAAPAGGPGDSSAASGDRGPRSGYPGSGPGYPGSGPGYPGSGPRYPEAGAADPLFGAPDPDSGPDSATTRLDALDGEQGDKAGPGQQSASPEGKKPKKFWRELIVIVVAAAILTLLVKAFVVQVYRIPSASMEDTLLIGDRVLVNKLVYHFRGIDRGDIIVFSGQGSWGPDAPPPSGNLVVRVFDDVLSGIGLHSGQTFYIKRVIGLPGDHVACCTNGKVTVNGVALNETSYLFPGAQPSSSPFDVTVPAGRLWVMGDNRDDSSDSRSHKLEGFPGQGTIPENEVVGRAFLVMWPPSQFNDLPIPDTFKQAALHSGAAGSTVLQVGGPALSLGGKALTVVAAAPVAGTAGAAGMVGAPLLLLRNRRRGSR
jgi:signal peptidase I